MPASSTRCYFAETEYDKNTCALRWKYGRYPSNPCRTALFQEILSTSYTLLFIPVVKSKCVLSGRSIGDISPPKFKVDAARMLPGPMTVSLRVYRPKGHTCTVKAILPEKVSATKY